MEILMVFQKMISDKWILQYKPGISFNNSDFDKFETTFSNSLTKPLFGQSYQKLSL